MIHLQGRRSRSGRGGHGRPTLWANIFFFNQLVISTCIPRWPRQGWTASWWFIHIPTSLISWTLSTLVTILCGDRNTVSLYLAPSFLQTIV